MLTHNLPQLSQETNFLSIITSPGSHSALCQTCRKPDCYLQKQSRKPTVTSLKIRMVRSGLTTESFPNFRVCFQLRVNQKRLNVHSQSITQDVPFRLAHLQDSVLQKPSIRAELNLLLASTIKLSHFSACLSASPRTQVMVADSLAMNKQPFLILIFFLSFIPTGHKILENYLLFI